MSMIEEAKKTAAYKAVNDHIKNNQVIGIGSGSTIIYAVEKITELIRTGSITGIRCVPTSFQARQLIVNSGLALTDLDIDPVLDWCIDGADEVDSNLNLIKGGGGCLLMEKIVASFSKKLVIVADYTKDSKYLGEKYGKVPIEVVPQAYKALSTRLQEKFGCGQFELRMAKAKMGPCVTDNGNFILDWVSSEFPEDQDWSKANVLIREQAGVVETGLFIKMAHCVYFGQENGTVLCKN